MAERSGFLEPSGKGSEALWLLTTLAGIRFTANLVHSPGQSGMGLIGNRTKRHCPGGKALDDLTGWFYLVQGTEVHPPT